MKWFTDANRMIESRFVCGENMFLYRINQTIVPFTTIKGSESFNKSTIDG